MIIICSYDFFFLMDISEYKDISSGRNISLLGEAKKMGRKKLKILFFLKCAKRIFEIIILNYKMIPISYKQYRRCLW